MVMAAERQSSSVAPIPLATVSLMRLALWNGCPFVVADTRTYLSQAIEHDAGLDRPASYTLVQ
jgi:hypothetical protein